jgi:hypothetical protein
VKLSNRVKRLEQKHATRGRCAACRDRAPVVLVSVPAIRIPDNGRDGIVPRSGAAGGKPTNDITSCATCGWQPNVIKIHRVVVYSDEREDRTLTETAR